MLSVKEYETYLYICHYFQRHEQSPTQDEIARGIGISSRGVVSRYLQSLVKSKLIELNKGSHRNIALVQQRHMPCTQLPVVAHFSEGEPLQLLNDAKIMDIPRSMLPEQGVVYRVIDEVFLQHNIRASDYLICDRREHRQGDRVLVGLPLNKIGIGHVDDTSSISLMKDEDNGIEYRLDDITIFGVYYGMLRLPIALNSSSK